MLNIQRLNQELGNRNNSIENLRNEEYPRKTFRYGKNKALLS